MDKPVLRFRYSDRTWMHGCAHIGWPEEMLIGMYVGAMEQRAFKDAERLLSGRRSGAVIDEWAKNQRG